MALPNDEASFTCVLKSAWDYYVYINGSPTVPDDIPGITIIISDQPNDVHVVTIIITATLQFNGTSVRCVLNQHHGAGSSIAYLWIAGKQCLLAIAN